MASLLGKADATIAGMSYREAMADVTPDLKSVYEGKALNQAMFQKGVEDHFNTLYADNNLLADELKEATRLAMADLGTDYEGMELFNTELTSMKTRMKALPKGKKGDFERAKIRGEMAELKRSTEGMEAAQTTLGTMIEAGDFDAQATGKLNLSQLKAIASGEAERKIVNGKLFYSFENPDGGKNIEVDQQVLRDMLIQTDPEHQGNFNKIHEASNANGKVEGTEFNRELTANKYEESFTSKKVFATNVNKKQHDLEYSLKEALQGKDTAGTLELDSIYETLMSIGNKDNFFNGSDTDKDGDVDAQDFASKENGIALIESLTDVNSKNFNFQVAKKVAAEFYADNISAKEFKVGVSLRAVVPQWKKEGYANKGAYLKAQSGSNDIEQSSVFNSKNNYGGWGSYSKTGGGGEDPVNLPWNVKEKRRNLLNRLETISGEHYNYYWDGESYWTDKEFTMDKMQPKDVAEIEGLLKFNETASDIFTDELKDNIKEKVELKPAGGISGGASISLINQNLSMGNTDDTAARNLNNHFSANMQKKYYFESYGGGGKEGTGAFTNDVVLYQMTEDGKFTKRAVINPKTNKPFRIGTGKNAKESDLADLNEFLKDYTKKSVTGDQNLEIEI